MTNYAAGLFILLGGLACLMLTQPGLRRVPRWSPLLAGRAVSPWILGPLCVIPVLLGSALSVSHAVAGTVTKIADLLVPGTVPYPAVWLDLDRTSAALWDILFYEPWFLAMGICLYLSAWRYLRDQGMTHTSSRRLLWALTATAAALAAFSIWLVAMDMTVIL